MSGIGQFDLVAVQWRPVGHHKGGNHSHQQIISQRVVIIKWPILEHAGLAKWALLTNADEELPSVSDFAGQWEKDKRLQTGVSPTYATYIRVCFVLYDEQNAGIGRLELKWSATRASRE